MKKRLSSFAAGMLLLVASSSSNAALIGGVTTTSSLGTFSSYCLPCLTDGTGLSSLSLAATHDASFPGMWLSNQQVPPGDLVFDLGGIYSLNAIGIWNYNASLGLNINLHRGVQQYSIDYSLDNLTYNGVIAPTVLTQGTASPLNADILNLGGVQAQYMRLNILSSYGAPLYVGLSEVQFDGVPSSVPEPTTLLLLGLGLAGLGFARKRLH
jgi:hypothetical protein